jgi:hypothetical protein
MFDTFTDAEIATLRVLLDEIIDAPTKATAAVATTRLLRALPRSTQGIHPVARTKLYAAIAWANKSSGRVRDKDSCRQFAKADWMDFDSHVRASP